MRSTYQPKGTVAEYWERALSNPHAAQRMRQWSQKTISQQKAKPDQQAISNFKERKTKKPEARTKQFPAFSEGINNVNESTLTN